MKEVIEKYYVATDGRRFENKNECEEYEESFLKLKELQTQKLTLEKEIACVEYILCGKGKHIESANSAGGSGHDGYYSKCPYCERLVGGYERRNTTFKVAEKIYKCEKCGNFFKYS